MVGYIEDIDDQGFVEAIEGGKIVTVEAEYAYREGLPILKSFHSFDGVDEKVWDSKDDEQEKSLESGGLMDMLANKKRAPIERALVPNFNWKIVQARRALGITRNKFGDLTGLNSKQIKMLENGIFPKADLTLLAKIEEILGINIRHGMEELAQPMRGMVDVDREARQKDFREVVGQNVEESVHPMRDLVEAREFENMREDIGEPPKPPIDIEVEDIINDESVGNKFNSSNFIRDDGKSESLISGDGEWKGGGTRWRDMRNRWHKRRNVNVKSEKEEKIDVKSTEVTELIGGDIEILE